MARLKIFFGSRTTSSASTEAALTGASATASAVGVAHSVGVTLSGQAATASAGALAPGVSVGLQAYTEARAVSDFGTGFLPNVGSTRWEVLDEYPPDDADYVSGSNPYGGVHFAPLADPGHHTGHVIVHRGKATNGWAAITLQNGDGTADLASQYWMGGEYPADWTTLEFALTEAEAAGITDYGSLRVNFAGLIGTTYFSFVALRIYDQASVIQGVFGKEKSLVGRVATTYAGSFGKAKSLVGVAAPAYAGTVGASGDVERALAGDGVTASAGLLGKSLKIPIGALSISRPLVFDDPVLATYAEVSYALSGQVATAYAGDVATVGDVVRGLVGSQAPAYTSFEWMYTNKGVSYAASGQAITAQAGTVADTVSVAISGASSAAQAGSVGAGADVTKAITGAQATAAQQALYSALSVAAVGSASTVVPGSVYGATEVGLLGIGLTSSGGTIGLALLKAIGGSAAITYVGALTPVEILNVVRNVIARQAYVTGAASRGVSVTSKALRSVSSSYTTRKGVNV